jgi:antitoxin component HigA of HigAB toxin-antitoxin module
VPATVERLPAKYLVKEEAPKIISSAQQHEAYISRLLELQRKAHRSAEETETAKLLVVLIADYELKHFVVEKASGVEVLRELMAANGLRQKDLANDLGGESIVSLILQEKRQLNRQQMEKLGRRFRVSPAVFF